MKRYRFLGVLLLAIFFVGCDMGNNSKEELKQEQKIEQERQENIKKLQSGLVTAKPADPSLAGKKFNSTNGTGISFTIKFHKNVSSCIVYLAGSATGIYPTAECTLDEEGNLTFDFTKYAKAMSTYTIEEFERDFRRMAKEQGAKEEEIEAPLKEQLEAMRKFNFFEQLNKTHTDYLASNPEKGRGRVSGDYKTITITSMKFPEADEIHNIQNTTFTLVESSDARVKSQVALKIH